MIRKTAPAIIVVTIALGLLLGVVGFAGFQRVRTMFARSPLAKVTPTPLSPFSSEEQIRMDAYQRKISLEFGEIENSDQWYKASMQEKAEIFKKFIGGEKNLADYYDLVERAKLWARTNYPPAPEIPAKDETTFTRPAFITLDNNNTISADFVQWLGDTVAAPDDSAPVVPSYFATIACIEDGACDAFSCAYEVVPRPCVPNGYYLKNRDKTTTPYTVDTATTIELPKKDDMTQLEKVTLTQFVDRMKQTNEVPGIHPLFSLEIKNNQLTSLSWIYTP